MTGRQPLPLDAVAELDALLRADPIPRPVLTQPGADDRMATVWRDVALAYLATVLHDRDIDDHGGGFMAKRYCEMCDEWVNGRECPACGMPTRSDTSGRLQDLEVNPNRE